MTRKFSLRGREKMNKRDIAFEGWFDLLQMNLADRGINFECADSVRDDYDKGKDLFDAVDEIAAE